MPRGLWASACHSRRATIACNSNSHVLCFTSTSITRLEDELFKKEDHRHPPPAPHPTTHTHRGFCWPLVLKSTQDWK